MKHLITHSTIYFAFTALIIFTSSCSQETKSDSQDSNSQDSDMGSNLKINEIVAKNISGNDWIELKNISNSKVELKNFSLMDITSIQPTNLPDITLLPGEYFTIDSISGSSEAGILPFGLGSEDTIFLRFNNQTVDSFSWKDGDAPSGFSFGYLNDVLQTLYPTKNSINVPNQLFFKDQVIEMSLTLSQTQWQTLLSSPSTADYQEIDVTYNDVKLNSIGLKFKSQDSIDYLQSLDSSNRSINRFNFKLDINNFVSGKKLFGAKKMYLHNGFQDPSMMREVLAYQLMNDIGLAAPRTTYIDLSLNIEGTVEHLGLYYLVEAIDSEFLDMHFPEDKANTGDLYEATTQANLSYISDIFSDYESYYELKNNDETINTSIYGASFLNMISSLNQNSGTAKLDYIDIDQVITYFAVNTVLSSLDNYFSSNPNDYYLYEQRVNTSKFTILPWDYNLAFGTYPSECDSSGLFIDSPSESDITLYPLLQAILQDSTLKAQYHNQIQSILDMQFNEDSMTANISRISSLIRPFISKSPSLFYTESTWENSLTQSVSVDIEVTNGTITQSEVVGLTEFIRLRNESVQLQLDANTDSSAYISACNDGI
ncbi:CotH kinase family protein [Marinicellulosiphila megalodicopiae]|uniref:CotH kinase family protein n=1 Tax=Marinicellulosiphila megalodicopiae TaxID=2724896 RepID=UPI003BB01012